LPTQLKKPFVGEGRQGGRSTLRTAFEFGTLFSMCLSKKFEHQSVHTEICGFEYGIEVLAYLGHFLFNKHFP